QRGPEGVHRAPQSLLRALAPFIAVIVIVPLLAWGAVSLLGGGGDGDPEAAPTGPAATAEPSEEPTAPDATAEETTPEEDSAEQTTERGPGEDVVHATSVSALNGAGVRVLAAEVAAGLTDAGFTTVGAADCGAAAPDVTTLYYRNADLAPSAEAIGALTGIDTIVEAPSAT